MLLFCHLGKSRCGEEQDVSVTIPEEGHDCRSNLFLSLGTNYMTGGHPLPFFLPLSQSFLLSYSSSSSLSCCGALSLLELYIPPLSCCPGFSCLLLIDCLINYAETQMQNHACATAWVDRRALKPLHLHVGAGILFFTHPADGIVVTPRQGAGQSLPGLLLCRCELHSGK